MSRLGESSRRFIFYKLEDSKCGIVLIVKNISWMSFLNSKIKIWNNKLIKAKASVGMLLVLLSVVFFGHDVQAASVCNAVVQFYVTDMNGAQISSLANKDTRFILYSKYTVDATCGQTFKHRFRNVFSDGSYETIGPEQSYTTDPYNKDFASKGYFEFKLPWQTSGLKDSGTKQLIQNGGTLQLASYLALTNGATVTQSDARTVSVRSESSAPPGQTIDSNAPGNNNNSTGNISVAQEKEKGLVPCGRDSAVTGSGPAGPRPSDSCTVRDLFTLMTRVTNYLILMAGFFATFQIIRSAFSMLLAQGSAEKITAAKKHLINSVLGLVLAMMAFLLINTIVNGILGLSGGQNILTNPVDYILQRNATTNTNN